MIWLRRATAVVASLILLSVSEAPRAQQPGSEAFERSELVIETVSGARHHFDVELALTERQQAQGLMFRRSMPADAGMLFVSPREREITMWMKNTFIPLDMIFADSSGRIVSIAKRAVPQSLEVISSRRPAQYVLEVNGGVTDRLGIAAGDRLIHDLVAGEHPD